MKIYEHISKEYKDVSVDNKNVRIYVCGPTVYNHVHIGNIRPIITFDIFKRLLKFLGYQVLFVHNITDIDDKIIDKAQKENKNELEVAKYFEEQYLIILKQLNISFENMEFPKVSDNMDNIINYVQKIVDNNYGYVSNGDVYFKTNSFKDYGIISNKQIGELETGEKSLGNSNKENEKDFALWKKTDIGIKWKSQYSEGRPGWHTECAYLINKYFNDQCDIHGGGIDLKFPHHENENAQNVAVNQKPIARIWMHVGHLNINNEKMSKSLNNFVLAKDILNDFNANHIRWFFMQTNYTNPLNFTQEQMKNIADEIDKIINQLNIAKSYLILENKYEENKNIEKNNILDFIETFNFPNLVTSINENLKKVNILLRQKKWDELNFVFNETKNILINILGIKIDNVHDEKNILLLKEWDALKKAKDFEKADNLRKVLIERSLI